MLGIIGGTGLAGLSNAQIIDRQVVRTPYGEPSGIITFWRIGDQTVAFLARHGYAHTIAPHEINYRANLWALAEQKVTHVIAIASVGGIREDLRPGVIAVPDQLIDYTYGRKHTFFEGIEKPVTHVDLTEPYDSDLRARILEAAHKTEIDVKDGGCYACTQGPRLETAAEIRRIQRDGGDMVGMTGMPEAALARELNLAYASIALVANYAAGLADCERRIDLRHTPQILQDGLVQVLNVVENLVESVSFN